MEIPAEDVLLARWKDSEWQTCRVSTKEAAVRLVMKGEGWLPYVWAWPGATVKVGCVEPRGGD